MDTKGATKGGRAKNPVPPYKKYAKGTSTWLDPTTKLKPSDLGQSVVNVVADDYPMIIEFVNMLDNTSQVKSAVDIDVPMFQVSPSVVVFEDYAPFAIHEKKIYFRNQDDVARRIKIMKPDSPFFEVSAPRAANGEQLKQSKIAAGMEVCFVIRFKPQEVRDYSLDLVCCTEREKFLVPIRAVGSKPRLSFPDEVHFGACPIKSTTRKTMLVQNIGSTIAKFNLKSSVPVFSCTGEDMVVEPGGSQMIELFFAPLASSEYEGEIEVHFSKGVTCFMAVSGSGRNVDVSLSSPSVTVESTYISLFSQKTVKVVNHSDIPIEFSWKSFRDMNEEMVERRRLHDEIDRMESLEMEAFMESVRNGEFGEAPLDGDADEDAFDNEDDLEMVPFSARAAEAALIRKYRNLRNALDNDDILFVDDIFDVTPNKGQVWANSEMEVTVSFRPDTAALFSCVAFLDISGREDRLALNLSGQGIGPHAALSFDVLDVGDVFINDPQVYELFISNKGDIPAHWSFLNSLTKFGNKFSFFPTEGVLQPGQVEKIKIDLCSDILGEFSENFRFHLQGNEDVLLCQIKGHVVGPTFHVDCKSIDFGVVSYDLLHSANVRLVNTSKISMTYHLHVPQDGTMLKKEFEITPCDGQLAPGGYVDVLVEFIPGTIKTYDYTLAADVAGVGEILLSVPIAAECFVSTLQIGQRELPFGDCFIRYPYEQALLLTNASDEVHTKFEFLTQPPYTKGAGTYEVVPSVGVVEPGGEIAVRFRVTAEKLGPVKVPYTLVVVGSPEPPLQGLLVCNGIGARLVLDKTELRWGNVECLKDTIRTINVKNDSLISASFKLFLKMARSKFELSCREMHLDAGDSVDINVTANLDWMEGTTDVSSGKELIVQYFSDESDWTITAAECE